MKYKTYHLSNFREIDQVRELTEQEIADIDIVARVLPFKTNNYVVNELIDWDNYQEDPLFILNFPQTEMLNKEHYHTVANLLSGNAGKSEIAREINEIRLDLNPHPAGQMEHNVPALDGERLMGMQHKYRETALFFPSQGQTCHAYCTFCFRWPQFTGMDELKFTMRQSDLLVEYLRRNEHITDVLFTGGDPMVMSAKVMGKYIDALLDAGISHLRNIRIGTRSLAFWPYRYLTDPDADEVIDLFRRITGSGMHLALMAHFSHPNELETNAVQEAVGRIRETGAQIRTQSPVLKHINDDPDVWAEMWNKQVALGMIPYYMFVARDTGARDYFAVPLAKTWEIFRDAYSQVSGIARTVRGPSMSANPGKVQILGVTDIRSEKVFVLNFIQARDPDWVGRPFMAKYNERAYWLTDLKPAFGESEFFYAADFRRMLKVEEDSMSIYSMELSDYFGRFGGRFEDTY